MHYYRMSTSVAEKKRRKQKKTSKNSENSGNSGNSGNSSKREPGSGEQIFKLKKPSRRVDLKDYSATLASTPALYAMEDPLLTASPPQGPQGRPYNGDQWRRMLSLGWLSIPVSRENKSFKRAIFQYDKRKREKSRTETITICSIMLVDWSRGTWEKDTEYVYTILLLRLLQPVRYQSY